MPARRNSKKRSWMLEGTRLYERAVDMIAITDGIVKRFVSVINGLRN